MLTLHKKSGKSRSRKCSSGLSDSFCKLGNNKPHIFPTAEAHLDVEGILVYLWGSGAATRMRQQVQDQHYNASCRSNSSGKRSREADAFGGSSFEEVLRGGRRRSMDDHECEVCMSNPCRCRSQLRRSPGNEPSMAGHFLTLMGSVGCGGMPSASVHHSSHQSETLPANSRGGTMAHAMYAYRFHPSVVMPHASAPHHMMMNDMMHTDRRLPPPFGGSQGLSSNKCCDIDTPDHMNAPAEFRFNHARDSPPKLNVKVSLHLPGLPVVHRRLALPVDYDSQGVPIRGYSVCMVLIQSAFGIDLERAALPKDMPMRLTYQDSDGDDIHISSDGELAMAIAASQTARKISQQVWMGDGWDGELVYLRLCPASGCC